MFMRLKANNSMILDGYIRQLNAAVTINREIIERAIRGTFCV